MKNPKFITFLTDTLLIKYRPNSMNASSKMRMVYLFIRIVTIGIFIFFASQTKAAIYTTTGVGTWDVNGPPPSTLPSGDIVNINHVGIFYDWPNTVTLQNGSTLNINNGGAVQLLNLVIDAHATLFIGIGGSLQSIGFIINNSNNVTIDGSLTDNSTFTNNGTITGIGTIDVNGVAGGTGTINGQSTNSIDFSVQVDLGSTLPVELLYFEIESIATGVKITWATATEINNDYFTIENSNDGMSWELVGKVDGKGTTSTLSSYNFFHKSPYEGISYYRLTQTDYNGDFEQFDIQSVIWTEEQLTRLKPYPNPTLGVFTVATHSLIKIVDLNGKDLTHQITTSKVNSGRSIVDISILKSGRYIVMSEDKNEIVILK